MPTARRTSSAVHWAKTRAIVANHVRAGRVYFHPAQHCYKFGQTRLRGITDLLATRFWPRYRLPFGADSLSGGSGSRKGRKRGSRVGREVSMLANAIARGASKLPAYLSKDRIDPLTRKFFALCAELRMRPRAGELAVGSPALRIATGVDCLLEDEHGKLVLAEIKCGMSACFNTAQGAMEAPFSAIPNSPRFQAIVQLAVTLVLYCHSNGPAARRKLADRHVIVHLSGAETKVEHVPAALLFDLGRVAAATIATMQRAPSKAARGGRQPTKKFAAAKRKTKRIAKSPSASQK